MSLADALEAAASALPDRADAIRPANGDPTRLLELLTGQGAGAVDAAAEVLAWLLENRADDAEELAEGWSATADGAGIVLAVDEAGLPKPGRKALRRVRHRLRSRGIGADAAPQPVVASLPRVEDDFQAAFLSAIDPSGARIAYLAEPNPSGGVRMFEMVLDDARGVAGFEVYTAPRKKTREFLERLESRGRLPMVAVSPDAVRAVVNHAAARQAADRAAPRTFAEWRTRLTDAGEEPLPGAVVAEALGEATREDGEALGRAGSLADAGEIGPWPASPDVLKDTLERIRSAFDSPLIVSDATQQEQVDRILDETLAEVYEGEAAATAAHRLRESAFVFWKIEREEDARACLAAAERFDAGDPATNAVARAFLEVPLKPSIEALASGEAKGEAPDGDDEPRLVTPVGGGGDAT